MNITSSRYGTFEASLERRASEIHSIDEQGFDGDAVSEINFSGSFVQSQDPIVKRQDLLIQNRLPLLYRSILVWLEDKGNLGILITLHIAIIGVFMLTLTAKKTVFRVIAQNLVSCGILGMAGGMTNWLALKFIFIRIPGVYGSGVFENCSDEIIKTFRRIVINIFLEQSFLEHFIEQKLPQLMVAINIEGQLRHVLESQTVELMINRELHALSISAEGQLLSMAGIRTSALRPLLRPMLMEMMADIIPEKLENLYTSEKRNTAVLLRQEITRYLDRRRSEQHTKEVSHFVKLILYKHLSWLVILGCGAGVLMGVISQITQVGKLI
ncbi:uncharacterized protein LOC5509698 [Nematostella vectensis]|uniref:uncharacterized protein LOC5509698 n=1 Tax=Nematostella vectensis TaxID=45351 RepID=UPI0020778C14|nr:uncharacterized protein LOC5509698 [Nematostella vectensis]